MAFKITIENLKETPIKIKVLDSIPVSRTDKVSVEDIIISPEPIQKNYQDQEGVLFWRFELQPKEKQHINLSFVVTYPKELPLAGL